MKKTALYALLWLIASLCSFGVYATCNVSRSDFEANLNRFEKNKRQFPLYRYCGCQQFIDEALAAGVPIDAPKIEGHLNKSLIKRRTLLVEAVIRNDLVTAKLALEKEANPNLRGNSGKTALHYASSPEMIDLLHLYQADINSTDHGGFSPIHTFLSRKTLSKNDTEAFKRLVSLGAKIENIEIILATLLSKCTNHKTYSKQDCEQLTEMYEFLKKFNAEKNSSPVE